MEPKQDYINGHRDAWRSMLQQCLINLGYNDIEAAKANWIVERENAVAQLRSVCESHGDNDWEESLDLGDVIDNHLARHLEE